MAKGKSGVEFNRDAFRELRFDPRVLRDLEDRAQRIAKRAASYRSGSTEGYKVTELVLESPRGAVSVMATGHAHSHNRKHNALVKALDAGRD